MIQSIQKFTLRQARLVREKSLQDMAKAIGVTAVTYLNYERKPEKISLDNVWKICKFLNLQPNEVDFSLSDTSSKKKN